MAKGVDFIIQTEDINNPGTFITLGGQRNGTLNRSADTIDTTTKDSDEWQENEVSIKSWSIDGDGLLVEDDTAYNMLEDAFMNGEKVKVQMTTAAGNKYTGNAIITDFPIEAPYDDAATYSISLMGDGQLTKTSA